MSVAKQIGNLFNRKPASQEAGNGVVPDQDALSVDELQNYSADGLNSVQTVHPDRVQRHCQPPGWLACG